MELGRLGEAFNAMLDRLESQLQAHARFTADISHELGNPLGSVMLQMQVASEEETSPEELRATLRSCLEITRRMNHLRQSLQDFVAGTTPTGRIRACIVGADRITARGDAANKIGTYALAVLANAHDVPFYVAAPSSTFDLALDDGADIPIEERAADEVLRPLGVQAAPAGARAYNPAFDVTPARLIRGIVTERGVIAPVTRENVLAMLRQEAR